MKTVSVIGLGYIGLPTAIVVAQSGYKVIGVDVDKRRVDRINRCHPIIEEPEIVERLHDVISMGHFRATSMYKQADCFVIAVPTPFKEDKKADLSYVYAAIDSIGKVLKTGDTIILESTVPVGTTTCLGAYLEKKTKLKQGKDFFLAHCPERVLPGNIFYELKVNDRIIGGVDHIALKKAEAFYRTFVEGNLYLTDASTAELVKLAENSYRDVNIAFAHELARVAERMKLNPYEVVELANKHPRVSILQPSCGVGGHCLAVDPWFLIQTFPQETTLLKQARDINDARPKQILKIIDQEVKSFSKKKVPSLLILGLTYKPDVDDLRESPALRIACALAKRNDIKIMICDPSISKDQLPLELQPFFVSLLNTIYQADIIIALVAHSQFKNISCEHIHDTKVLDFCGLFYAFHTQKQQRFYFWPAQGTQFIQKKAVNGAQCMYNNRESSKKEKGL